MLGNGVTQIQAAHGVPMQPTITITVPGERETQTRIAAPGETTTAGATRAQMAGEVLALQTGMQVHHSRLSLRSRTGRIETMGLRCGHLTSILALALDQPLARAARRSRYVLLELLYALD